MKKLILLLALLPFTIFAQDTITFNDLKGINTHLNGKYVVVDASYKITVSYVKEGEAITETTNNAISYYQIAEFKNGLKHGTWFMYKKGTTADTLFTEGFWQNDTLEKLTCFYPNKNTEVINTYYKGKLTSESYFVADGRKYLEYNYLYCNSKFDDYDAVVMEYNPKGTIRRISKNKMLPNKKPSYNPYGETFLYNKKGKVCLKNVYENNKIVSTVKYRRCGKWVEWYNKKY